ncbi:MAG: SUMF1/EgtB/PvdO family nonheme iron enzyme [Acidobacteriota bacterium]
MTGAAGSSRNVRRWTPEAIACAKGHDRDGENRVLRGGSWINNARNLRAAYRNGNHPSNRNSNIGFRLSRARGQPEAPWTRSCAGPLVPLAGGKWSPGAGALVGRWIPRRRFAGARFFLSSWRGCHDR